MGRETIAVCHWQGDVAEVKLHLDGTALQLRGDIRVDIPRTAITCVELVSEGLEVATDGPTLMMELAQRNAKRWQTALLKKPPTLAEKLGLSEQTPAFVQGQAHDAPLDAALNGCTVVAATEAAILLAIVLEDADLPAASDMALANPDKHIWMIYRKGKAAEVGDTAIRTHMRALGFIDSKTSAVSNQLTATRYRMRS